MTSTIKTLSLICIVFIAFAESQTRVGFAYPPYPDAIRCGNYFYYLMHTTPTLSTYNAITGSSTKIESYNASNGVLSSKIGTLTENCENQTIQSLWESNRAFRIFNIYNQTSRSIENNDKYPDIIQCQKGTLLYRSHMSSKSMLYQNPTGPEIQFNSKGGIDRKKVVECGSKSLDMLVADSQTFNIATQVATTGTPSVSMTGKYPDFLKCKQQDLYIHYISSDQAQVTYRGLTTLAQIQVQFLNGKYKSSKFDVLIPDCIKKPIKTLINQGKAFNINTPLLECPRNITSTNPVVNFKAISAGNLILNYSHRPNKPFLIGQTTNVTVVATHTNFDINLKCTFGVKILDTVPPHLTCPGNITSKVRRVSFAAIAIDNSAKSVNISYSSAPGSRFGIGKTEVNVTATDASGNQAHCSFNVTVVDQKTPILDSKPVLKRKVVWEAILQKRLVWEPNA